MPNSPLYPRRKTKGRKPCPWTELANHLKAKSKEICEINQCKPDDHNCESCAYITAHGTLLDVCLPDYFQGHSQPVAAVPLPWKGCGRDLKQEVENDIGLLDL